MTHESRNKYCFGLGTVGRDMFYAFEANTLLYFLSDVLSYFYKLMGTRVRCPFLIFSYFFFFRPNIKPLKSATLSTAKKTINIMRVNRGRLGASVAKNIIGNPRTIAGKF